MNKKGLKLQGGSRSKGQPCTSVSLGGLISRRTEHWKPEELVVGVPAYKLHQIVEGIDCSA